MNNKIKFKNDVSNTSIIIKKNFITKYLKLLSNQNRKVFYVIDIKVKKLLNIQLNENTDLIYLKCGENIKNINFYQKICEKLLIKNIDRNCILVCIGGGTLGDLCGFVASTILRGIDYKLIPTTLLSQVDSSIGGKNGVNSKYGKNLIGTFYNPSEVIIDVNFLKTLPKREIKSGYVEIIKHALIKDVKFFKWLENNYIKIFNLNTPILEKAIFRSLKIKLWYVQKDSRENLINKNSRAMLNFGHSIGHSLETFYNYKKINHGEAVSIGIVTEAKISNKLGYLSKNDLIKILEHFKNAELKILDKNIYNKKLISIIQKDKKNLHGKLNLVLLKNIGRSFFARNIDIRLVNKIIQNI